MDDDNPARSIGNPCFPLVESAKVLGRTSFVRRKKPLLCNGSAFMQRLFNILTRRAVVGRTPCPRPANDRSGLRRLKRTLKDGTVWYRTDVAGMSG